MLTVDFDRFPVGPGHRVLDLGAGQGRHTYEILRRGAEAVAVDLAAEDLEQVEAMVGAMALEGEIVAPAAAVTHVADALDLPFADRHFDRVIAAEILEHLPDDRGAIAEIVRVTVPGGLVAVTVPRRWPEQVCWALSDAYHEVEGGHVRIYRASELRASLEAGGLVFTGSHHAHALHSPYWWLKCAVGVDRETALTRAYHRLLVWDMMTRPTLTRVGERVLNPVLGKSVVLYFRKPDEDTR
ncbi:methyltransferase domain-containing protein [Nostocoides sp. F2B08]|uniref:class I SAM-dependent methyltransferase n=1 Tax=Nostocoides sp. F2B08 TaxID=2653936 RepID=UPI001263A789|nr:class I SAM-dependent methyltransferase [Tetrasphaera sp. F2B08]KAB7743208.1 methyltransferase domain-containing protein [Tetrasphaera sp. F2B08]